MGVEESDFGSGFNFVIERSLSRWLGECRMINCSMNELVEPFSDCMFGLYVCFSSLAD
jgi:hypothetical protein